MTAIYLIANLIDILIEYYAKKYENVEYNDNVIIHFLQGNCGILALTLKEIFPEGNIYINGNHDHLVFKINDFYYDARGLLDKHEIYEKANESDFFKLIPYYGSKNFYKTQKIVNDLAFIGLFYKNCKDWQKTQEYMVKKIIKLKKEN